MNGPQPLENIVDPNRQITRNKTPEIEKILDNNRIRSIPTWILFKDGEEIKRFQADLSFKMLATRKEIQEFINEQIMSDF